MNADEFPDLAPIVCESCGQVGMLESRVARKLADGELEQLKLAPVWKEFIGPALEIIEGERAKRS